MRIILAYDRTRKGENVKRGLRILLAMAATLPWCALNSAEPLGRLFFTPAQRHALDAGKYVGTPSSIGHAPQTVHLDGVVTRSDGGTAVWINGHEAGETIPGVKVAASTTDPTSAQLRIDGMQKPVRLRVGQKLSRDKVLIAEPAAPATAEVVRTLEKSKPEDGATRAGTPYKARARGQDGPCASR